MGGGGATAPIGHGPALASQCRRWRQTQKQTLCCPLSFHTANLRPSDAAPCPATPTSDRMPPLPALPRPVVYYPGFYWYNATETPSQLTEIREFNGERLLDLH